MYFKEFCNFQKQVVLHTISVKGFSSLTNLLFLITTLLGHKVRNILSGINSILLISVNVFYHFMAYSEDTELIAWLPNSILSTA